MIVGKSNKTDDLMIILLLLKNPIFLTSLKCLNLPKSYKNMIRGTLDNCEKITCIEFLADSIEIDNYCLSKVQNFTINDYKKRTDFTIFLLSNAITEFEVNESECVPY